MDILFFLSVLIPTITRTVFYIVGLRNVLQDEPHKYHLHKSVYNQMKIRAAPTHDLHRFKGVIENTYVINNTFQCKKICRCTKFLFFQHISVEER